MSVVIGLRTCGTDCEAIASTGTVGAPLFKGDYSPQTIPGSFSTAAFQNYTVQVPATTPKGPALLSVAHFFLGGVSLGRSPSEYALMLIAHSIPLGSPCAWRRDRIYHYHCSVILFGPWRRDSGLFLDF